MQKCIYRRALPALWFGMLAFLATVTLSAITGGNMITPGESSSSLAFLAGLSTMIAASCLGGRIVDARSPWRAAGWGAAIVFGSYIVLGGLFAIFSAIGSLISHASYDNSTSGILSYLAFFLLIFPIYGPLLTGWITFPVGTIGGAVFYFLKIALSAEPTAKSADPAP